MWNTGNVHFEQHWETQTIGTWYYTREQTWWWATFTRWKNLTDVSLTGRINGQEGTLGFRREVNPQSLNSIQTISAWVKLLDGNAGTVSVGRWWEWQFNAWIDWTIEWQPVWMHYNRQIWTDWEITQSFDWVLEWVGLATLLAWTALWDDTQGILKNTRIWWGIRHLRQWTEYTTNEGNFNLTTNLEHASIRVDAWSNPDQWNHLDISWWYRLFDDEVHGWLWYSENEWYTLSWGFILHPIEWFELWCDWRYARNHGPETESWIRPMTSMASLQAWWNYRIDRQNSINFSTQLNWENGQYTAGFRMWYARDTKYCRIDVSLQWNNLWTSTPTYGLGFTLRPK